MPSRRIEIPFCGEHSRGESIFLNPEECINYYPERDKGGRITLRGSPGLADFADTGSGSPTRGGVVCGDYLFVVQGMNLYRIDQHGTVTAVSGDMALTEDVVSVIENGATLGIFGGDTGYYYTLSTNTLAEISDTAFPGATTATYQDGFAIINRPGTNQFYKSALNDFSDWTATDFSSAGWKSDNLVRVFSDHRDLLLIGSKSTEPWYNTGSTFPFSRRRGSEMEIGIAAPHSVDNGDNGVFWLSRSKNGHGMVVRSLGLQIRKVSSPAVDDILASCSTISDAIGWCYQMAGHVFYELTLPSADISLVYDSTEDMWHRRASYFRGQGLFRHRAQFHWHFAGKNLAGSRTGGGIYELSPTAYDEVGIEMPAIRVSPPLRNNQDLITYHELWVMFTPGVGEATGADSVTDPVALLSWADDGGYTFGNEIDMHLGKIGEYKNCARVHRLGQARNRVWKLKVTAPVNRDIIGAVARITVDNV
jgi:hypothetical protein